MIHVVAIITAKPGKLPDVMKEVRANLANVRAEKGCVHYFPAVDVPGFGGPQTEIGPDSFIMLEAWETEADLKAHGAAPHMAAYAGRTREMLASRVIHVLKPGE
jgi:quinol monooxygenase YgiN